MAMVGEYAFLSTGYSDLAQMQQFFVSGTAALAQANHRLQQENMLLRGAARARMMQKSGHALGNNDPCLSSMLAGTCKKSPKLINRRFKSPVLEVVEESTEASTGPPSSREESTGCPDEEMNSPEEITTTGSTSTMMRNLPNDYTRAMLLDLLHLEGFEGTFDFLYLPIDFRSKSGLGYAFINFTTTQEAQQFCHHFTGFNCWTVGSDKVCEVSWSSLQGLDAHIERYRDSPVMHESIPDEHKPMLFEGSERLAFPPPTKKIRVPRHWHRRP